MCRRRGLRVGVVDYGRLERDHRAGRLCLLSHCRRFLPHLFRQLHQCQGAKPTLSRTLFLIPMASKFAHLWYPVWVPCCRGCPCAMELLVLLFMPPAGALAAAAILRGHTQVDHLGVSHARCTLWGPLQQRRSRLGGVRATPGAHQLARKARRRCRPQHYDVAPSLPAAGVQARPASPHSRPLHAVVLAPLLASPLVEEVQRAQTGARVQDGTVGSNEAENLSISPPRPGESDEEGGDRHYARSLLCNPPDLARPARPARVARASHTS